METLFTQLEREGTALAHRQRACRRLCVGSVSSPTRLVSRRRWGDNAPVADVFSMLFTAETPGGGRQVIGTSIPASAEGLEIIETWDTIGCGAPAATTCR